MRMLALLLASASAYAPYASFGGDAYHCFTSQPMGR